MKSIKARKSFLSVLLLMNWPRLYRGQCGSWQARDCLLSLLLLRTIPRKMASNYESVSIFSPSRRRQQRWVAAGAAAGSSSLRAGHDNPILDGNFNLQSRSFFEARRRTLKKIFTKRRNEMIAIFAFLQQL